MAIHSSTLAWKIPWMEEPGRLQSMGSLESDTTERLHFHFSLSCIGGGNGNPVQCSCLEIPRDGEAWQAAVHGVAQSWTRLKLLSSSSSSWVFSVVRAFLQLWSTEATLQLWCAGFSLLWLLLFQSLGCRACRLQQLWCVVSVVKAPRL